MTHRQIAERVIGSLTSVSSPAVSPDGRQVAFVVTRVDLTENKYRSQIWLARTDGSDTPRPITSGETASSPAWSPDGTKLAFVATRGEKKNEATLHVLPVDVPGETVTVASMPDGIGDVRFSPDGAWIGFLSRTRDARYEAKDESWQAPRKIETFFTRLNGVGWITDRPTHVYVVATDGTGAPRNLTPGPYEHSALAWSADSKSVVVSGLRYKDWDRTLAEVLHRVTLTGKATPLTDPTISLSMPSVSPDGRWIAAIGSDDPATSPKNGHIAVMKANGSDLRWVSTGLDRTFAPYPGVRAPVWQQDATLLCSTEDRGTTQLTLVHVDGSDPEMLTNGPITVTGFDSAAGVTVVTAGAVDRAGDVYVVDGGQRRALTSFSERYQTAASPRTWERFEVPCTDKSDTIDAWIMRPANLRAGRTYPVLLNVHGGPFTQYGERLFDEAQMQAAAGFVVVMCNPRGGSGRTEAWGQSINGPMHPVAPGTGWGSKDAADLLAVVATTLKRYPFCDRSRVGMLGGSYGGYMATWLAGNTGTTFKAICSERAVNNMLTEEFTSDIATFFRSEMGCSYLDHPEEYERISPVRDVRSIEVPMLLIHSEDDLRCPINQAEELFVALRLLDKDVTFYRFPAENHELSRSGSPVHRVQRAEIILDWFKDKLG